MKVRQTDVRRTWAYQCVVPDGQLGQVKAIVSQNNLYAAINH